MLLEIEVLHCTYNMIIVMMNDDNDDDDDGDDDDGIDYNNYDCDKDGEY